MDLSGVHLQTQPVVTAAGPWVGDQGWGAGMCPLTMNEAAERPGDPSQRTSPLP